jgi:lon-related putative ATP-dependent protease
MIQGLSYEKLRKSCDPKTLNCESSAELTPRDVIIGQERAIRALNFGLTIKRRGFNMYVAGAAGTGRITAVGKFLEVAAKKDPSPDDWCYVYNFRDGYTPKSLRFPPGKAVVFQGEMEALVKSVLQEIRNAFESEEYANHREETIKSFQQQKQVMLENLNKQAYEQGFVLQATPVGLMTIPLINGKPVSEEDFAGLPPDQRNEIASKQDQLQTMIESTLRQVKGLDKDAGEELQKLDQRVGQYAISQLVQELRRNYEGQDHVLAYLEQVEKDILENLVRFKPEGEEKPAGMMQMSAGKDQPTQKYMVNVVVDNSELTGAPVVIEQNPTYINLIGLIEQEARFGTLVTDFTLIRKGSLHKANGGYLVLPVDELLTNPLAWESLKRALENGEIVIEDAREKVGYLTTKSLRPEPIPLDVKVILIGRPLIYELLYLNDERFREHFKVKVDFDTQMDRTDENMRNYAFLVSTVCQQEGLKHLNAEAIAGVVEYGSRLAGDQEKLSTRFGEIADIVREASFYADEDGVELVSVDHVNKAIDERYYRSSMIQERIDEMIKRDVIKIELSGEQVGQVNGLSVVELGDISFGQPNRITATVGIGREGLIDIEREAELGGPIHSKGVMILSGYLTNRFAQDKPMSLSARLVFEQSYSGVEGDSASSTELYALLSELSGLPVKQGIAVTGSVNQKGEVQAIGGVNEKIEGFFEICKAKGLNGEQGVMIPLSNASNLMLKKDVIDAVKNGQFQIWPVETIEEGIEILTGVKADERKEDGIYNEETVFGRVDKRLKSLAETLEAFDHFKGKATHR